MENVNRYLAADLVHKVSYILLVVAKTTDDHMQAGHGSAVASFVTKYRRRDSKHRVPFHIELE